MEKDGSKPLELQVSVGKTLGEAEGRAKVFGLYADTWSRIIMVLVIAAIFIGLNYKVMSFIEDVFKQDIASMKLASPPSRIVTTEVLMSLIGATVVQVGVATIAIVSYLFPKTKPPID